MVIKEGYKQTEIGEIPKDWEVKSFKEVSYMKGRIGWQGLNQTEFTMNSNEPFLITGMNFKNGAIRWDEVYHISEERYEIAKDIQLKDDDVLMTKDGTIGKLLYVENIPYPYKASLNSHLLVFRPLKNSYNPKYLYYNLLSPYFFKYIELTKSGTTFFGISQTSVGEYKIILPPLAEQTAIATALSDADGLITGLEKLIAKKRNIKQGVIQQLLKPKEGWMNNEIGNVFQFRQGVQCAIEKQSTEDSIGLKRFIRIVDLSQTKEIPRYINDPGLSHHIKKTDLFMVRYGNPGLLGYGYDGVIANNLFRLIPKIRIESNFFYYLLYSKNEDILQLSSSTTMAALNFTSLKILKLDYPKSLSEQTRIAKILSDMDGELSALEQKLEKYKKVKLGMMQELLSGKTRLV